MPGKCVFNPLWLENDCYKTWIAAVMDDKNKALCQICGREFDIGRMGESALKSHMKGAKHIERLKVKNKTHGMTQHFQRVAPPVESASSASSSTKGSDSQALISSFVAKETVLDAEILWVFKCIKSHFSYNSCEETSKLFQKMFPDSNIASKFSCGATKCAYICCFGLAPYFKSCLLKCMDSVEHYTLLFDETLNQSLQSKQMDIHLRFWHDEECKIKTCYLASAFMGHAKAEDLLTAFYEAVEKLKLSKILQLSMDGPYVNWKFFDSLQKDLMQQFGHEAISIGSCGLHIMNNAFKHGENSTDWNIAGILTSLYWLFKDSPARREDFSSLSSQQKFPVKFCNYRWLESVPCVERAIQIWPDIIIYVKNVEKGNFSSIKNKSYLAILEASKDKLMLAKFHFFLAVAKIVQQFLEFYQSDAPLLPFFANDTVKLVNHCVDHFNVFKPEQNENFTTALKLCKFDFTDKSNYSPVDKISLGFSADKLIKQLLLKKEISDKESLILKHEAQKFVISLLDKLMKKCPINYLLVRSSSCFDPQKMIAKPTECQKSLKQMLMLFAEKNIIPDEQCDDIIFQYKHFLDNVVNIYPSQFSSYKPDKMRLDTFLYEFVNKDGSTYEKLWSLMKIIMTLSHGQASVERGFSVNKNLESENLMQESYVSQRLIADAINQQDILTIPITKEMRSFVASARQKYMLHLETKQKEKWSKETNNKRKLISEEIENLKAKKLCLKTDITTLGEKSEALSEEAEKKNDISLFIKSNSLRKVLKERNVELNDIDIKIESKVKELRNFS